MTHILFLVMTNVGLNGSSGRMLDFPSLVEHNCAIFLMNSCCYFMGKTIFNYSIFFVHIQPTVSNIQQQSMILSQDLFHTDEQSSINKTGCS